LYDVRRRVFNAHTHPFSWGAGLTRTSDVFSVNSVKVFCFLKAPNDGSHTHTQLGVGHVSLSSHLEQYSYASRSQGSGLHE
jgi:hypothetical protein